MYKRHMIILTLCLLITLLTACSTQKQPMSQPVDAQAASTAPEQSTVIGTMPGLVAEVPMPAADGFLLPAEGVRPLAVMIDNEGSKVLPQGGLDKAQIVYEIIVEGGLTRIMPVFWGTEPEMIGPVRSARHYFLDFGMEYDAIYVHYGGSPQAGKDIMKLKINEIDGLYLGTDVFRDLSTDKSNWQDSYTSMEKLQAYSQKRKYDTATDVKFPFTYNQTDVIPEDGQLDASVVTLKYPSMTSKYEYDSATGLYKRFRYGKEHMERVSGKQLEAKNIIVRCTQNYDIKGDKSGRQEMITTGSGKGYYITCGKAVKINWSKESRNAQTRYTDESGNEIKLNRGQTWIQVMPLTAKVTME